MSEQVTNTQEPVPNPGSEEAQAQGCTCPVWDNHYGRGYMGQPNVFVRVEGCPLHGVAQDDSNAHAGN
jgi:hypothetical protein